ncbi:MAG: potassium-transporting ATPase subunit KdpC [Haliscomenobacter sp.]|nr:potassium-transporting ATPase subunit KdpC [Haliscomenobacter sp.]MBK8880693.1 potassium-transporting ATPase subunit KdpC [Haliscomenobacter sp.]
MKHHILPAIRLTVICLGLCVGAYSFLMWGIAKLLGPNGGEVVLVQAGGQIVGVKNIGQAFITDRYFWGRPSAVNYNGAGSGGSNKGPSNPDYLQVVAARIDTLLAKHPNLRRSDIPSDLVTASGSGLDPHISVAAAMIQVSRVARARGLDEGMVRQLVRDHTEKPLFGLFGTPRVQVLELNMALDQK